MPFAHTFTFSSVLNVPSEQLWQRVSTLSGANAEMAPWFRMMGPAGVDRLEPGQLTRLRKHFGGRPLVP